MGAQLERARVSWREVASHQLRPQAARCAQFRDFHEKVHARREEEREPRCKLIDRQTARERCSSVFQAIGEGEAELEVERRSGLLHVIAGDRDRVVTRHVPAGVLDDIGHDAHRRCGRIDVGVPHHELFENIVLNRAAELRRRHALLLRSHDVAGQDRQHRAVHGHRHAGRAQRDAIEQALHVFDRVDGDTGLADVTGHARVIAVVAAVGGQIEGDAQPALTGSEVPLVEGVALFGRGKAGILADRPRARGVHRGTRTTPKRVRARAFVQVLDAVQIFARVQGTQHDALGRLAVQRVWIATIELGPSELAIDIARVGLARVRHRSAALA